VVNIASVDFFKNVNYVLASFIVNCDRFSFGGAEFILVFGYSSAFTGETTRFFNGVVVGSELLWLGDEWIV